MSAQSPGNDVEDYIKGVEKEVVGEDEREGESDGDRTRMRVTRNPMKRLQLVLEEIVPSSFPRIGLLTNFCQK